MDQETLWSQIKTWTNGKANISITMYQLTTIVIVLSILAQHSVRGNCSRSVSYSRDESGADKDNVQQLGDDISKIDKITKVVMRTGNFGPACPPFGCNHVIRQMEVTYRMTDGTPRVLRFGKNIDIRDVVTVNVPENEAITSVKIKSGVYLDDVTICLSGGSCKRAGGGGAATKTFSKSRSVIKAFFYKSGEVVDRLGVHYETNKIIRLESKDPNYSPTKEVTLDDVFAPENLYINDNSDGTSAQTVIFKTSTEVTTSETTTVSTTFGGSVSLSLTASAGVDLKVFSAGIETTYEAGASWSTTNEEARSFSETKKRGLDVPLMALPGSIEQVETYYTQASYEYSWTAPVTCYYSYAPGTAVSGDDITGTTQGVYGIPTIRTQFSTVQEAPVAAPVAAPVTAPATTPSGDSPTAILVDAPADTVTDSSLANSSAPWQDPIRGYLVFAVVFFGTSLLI